jgi:hypothetical protein
MFSRGELINTIMKLIIARIEAPPLHKAVHCCGDKGDLCHPHRIVYVGTLRVRTLV